MPAPGSLEAQLAEAERRAVWATARVRELHAEVLRLHESRRVAIGAVVAVALAAILMLGVVAFKMADTADDRESGAGGAQLIERVVSLQ